MPKVKIYVKNKYDEFALTHELKTVLKKVCTGVLKSEKINFSSEISITLVDNQRIKRLNKKHRNIDRETDVLSFPMFEREDFPKLPRDEQIPLGDIVISIEKTAQQARNYGHSFEREFAFLTAHSMLHLLGYDHEILSEEKDMFARQEKVLDDLGFKRD